MSIFLYRVRRFLLHRFIFCNVAVSVVLQMLMWSYLAFNFQSYSSSAFLHYTVGIGVDLVGNREQLFEIPGIGFVLFFINTIVAFLFFERSRQLSFFFVGLTNLLHALLVITILLVVSLNI